MCVTYNDDGKVNAFNFAKKGKTIYGKFYTYSTNGRVTFSELFDPIIELNSDTINNRENEVRFTVNLPIPDTLIESKYSYFRYGLKPISLRDSFLLETEMEIKIFYNNSTKVVVPVKSREPQILYGFVYDKIGPKVHNPFSRKITFVE